MIRPRYILELGTFTGYSALCMAEALPENGEIHTIEIDDEIEDFTRSHLEQSPFGDRIFLYIGNALDIVPTLNRTFDLVFIDADKRMYSEYFDLVFDRVRSGGFILADNTLWDGKVVERPPKSDLQTIGVQTFNDKIAKDNRIEKVILPLRDGLTIIRKK